MKRLIFAAAFLIGLICFLSAAQHVFAFNPFSSNSDQLCQSINSQGQHSVICSANQSDPLTGASGQGILIKVASLLSLVVGIAAVIIIIIGGIQYVLSSGDPARVNSAKNTILFALIGAIISALAQGIIRFVLVKL